jgi:hypothetical protein
MFNGARDDEKCDSGSLFGDHVCLAQWSRERTQLLRGRIAMLIDARGNEKCDSTFLVR